MTFYAMFGLALFFALGFGAGVSYAIRRLAPVLEPDDDSPACSSRAHPDFVGGEDVPCVLRLGHGMHRNGRREWTP